MCCSSLCSTILQQSLKLTSYCLLNFVIFLQISSSLWTPQWVVKENQPRSGLMKLNEAACHGTCQI